jgi:5,10-methenyltetrahydrofolate synthetase
MQNKLELRSTLLASRTALAADQRALFARRIGEKILQWWRTEAATTLGVYWPMRGEPDLHQVYAELHAQGVQLALPMIVGDNSPMQFVAWTPGETLRKDRFGASVPLAENALVQPQALLIPCLGFNAECFRLGYGGGFYDRTLAQEPRPRTLGVAYAFGEVDFAAEVYDIALDIVMTEEGTFRQN